MNNCWTILQIEPTEDKKAIRQAYAKQLLLHNPEIDPEGFQKLRAAYESALSSAISERVHPEIIRSPTIGSSIPKAAEIFERPPGPSIPETTRQAIEMADEVSNCQDEPSMVSLLEKWKVEGAFDNFNVSLNFQELLIDLLYENSYPTLLIKAYRLFSWDEILQKKDHPLWNKLNYILNENDLQDILNLLEKAQGFPLHTAVITDDIETAQELLSQNRQFLEQTDRDENTPLHLACEAYSLECVQFLIQQGSSLESKNRIGYTPLAIAIDHRDLELVKILTNAGAKINSKNILRAVVNLDEELVEYLITRPNVKLEPETLCIAVLCKHLPLVKLLVEFGCEISPKSIKEPALVLAARFNQIQILDYLLLKGADPNQTDQKSNTALVIAAARGFITIVERLLKAEPADNAIFLAAQAAIKNSHFPIVQLLLDSFELTTVEKINRFRGIKSSMHSYGFASCMDDMFLTLESAFDYNKPLEIGNLPPLFQAIYLDDLSALRKLLENGTNPHQTIQNGLAALHVAIQLHKNSCFDCLIEHSANINQITAPFNFSPLFIAVKVRNRHAFEKLMELGAKDPQTAFSHTALYAAVYNNDLSAAKKLIATGSDLNQYAGEGLRTLVYAAARHQHYEMLKLLLSYKLDPDRIGGDPWAPNCINYDVVPEAAMTALSIAVKNQDLKMIQLLLDAGANPNRITIGIPPLHLALGKVISPDETLNYSQIIESSHAAIDLLLEYGADIDLQGKNGLSFLIKTIRTGPIETVMHLVESGSNLHLPDSDGKFPIDHAKERKYPLLIQYLEQEMRLRPKLTSEQVLSRFLSSFLDPTLKAHGYVRDEEYWIKDCDEFFLVIQLQRFFWVKESYDFCFNIGLELKINTYSNCITAESPETAYISKERKVHKYKKRIGYSIPENTVLSDFIKHLSRDFENEILPCLERLKTVEDCVKFYRHFPTFGEHSLEQYSNG